MEKAARSIWLEGRLASDAPGAWPLVGLWEQREDMWFCWFPSDWPGPMASCCAWGLTRADVGSCLGDCTPPKHPTSLQSLLHHCAPEPPHCRGGEQEHRRAPTRTLFGNHCSTSF